MNSFFFFFDKMKGKKIWSINCTGCYLVGGLLHGWRLVTMAQSGQYQVDQATDHYQSSYYQNIS